MADPIPNTKPFYSTGDNITGYWHYGGNEAPQGSNKEMSQRDPYNQYSQPFVSVPNRRQNQAALGIEAFLAY